MSNPLPLMINTVQKLLDEGIHPVTIRSILQPIAAPYDDMSQRLLTDIIKLETEKWLTRTEKQLQDYASDESWTRLGQLLDTYQKVVIK